MSAGLSRKEYAGYIRSEAWALKKAKQNERQGEFL
jgi:hypothetical protein